MTVWERKIIDAFISHYFASGSSGLSVEDRSSLRIRTSVFFPGFDSAHPDEKESYLEAAESLERKGIISLNWEKRSRGERLKTLSCEDFEKLFEEADRPFPRTEAEEIKTKLKAKAKALGESHAASQSTTTEEKKAIAILKFLSIHFSPREIGQGIDSRVMEEFVRLLEFNSNPAQTENITTRALSIQLYRDSKRLEDLLTICKPLLSRMEKTVAVPDLTFLERSYPETMISGKIVIKFKNQKTPMVNTGGNILGFPLETAEEISGIQLVPEQETKSEVTKSASTKSVLTIENKETFYAIASPHKQGESKGLSRYDCFLYAGGYSNRAAAAIVKILSASGFSFYHAGDLDPDGILILQQIQEIADKPVTPVHMDAATFDQYRAWARTLSKPMLHQIKKIKKETGAIPGLTGLLLRIVETGLGVEQEIIDYRK